VRSPGCGPRQTSSTTEKFKNFELSLEWNVAPGGNSGIFYRASEDPDDNAIYWSAPEMQGLDDSGMQTGSPLTAAGSAYGIYPSPAGVVKPAGQWNQVRLVVNGKTRRALAQRGEDRRVRVGSPDWEGQGESEQVRLSPALRT